MHNVERHRKKPKIAENVSLTGEMWLPESQFCHVLYNIFRVVSTTTKNSTPTNGDDDAEYWNKVSTHEAYATVLGLASTTKTAYRLFSENREYWILSLRLSFMPTETAWIKWNRFLNAPTTTTTTTMTYSEQAKEAKEAFLGILYGNSEVSKKCMFSNFDRLNKKPGLLEWTDFTQTVLAVINPADPRVEDYVLTKMWEDKANGCIRLDTDVRKEDRLEDVSLVQKNVYAKMKRMSDYGRACNRFHKRHNDRTFYDDRDDGGSSGPTPSLFYMTPPPNVKLRRIL